MFLKKPVDKLKKEDFFSKLKNKCPSDDQINRTKEIVKTFNIKKGEQLTKLLLKSDIFFLADVFEKFNEVSTKGYGNNLLYCVSLHGYTIQCALKKTDNEVKTLQDKDLILTSENNLRGGVSSIMGDRKVKSDENK